MKQFVSLLIALICSLTLLAQDYAKGAKVEILWSGSWYKGFIKEVKGDSYKISYDGWTSSWDEWVGKDRLRFPGTAAAPKQAKPAAATAMPVVQKESVPSVAGANPMAGRWEATVTNGYKGDKLFFTVSADGKRITNVVFKGYWKDPTLGLALVEHLNPPNPFPVTKGAFGAVQQVETARMWWEFIGVFTSPTVAEGSYRAAYAGGVNDTYKLKWTAKRVGK